MATGPRTLRKRSLLAMLFALMWVADVGREGNCSGRIDYNSEPVCTENSNSDVVMVKPAEARV
jgi:hypothetical protein